MQGNTKERIIETFEELAKERPQDRITVKDVVEACGITRKTFYYHFKDIFDLAETILERHFDQLFDRIIREPSPEAALKMFFRFMIDNRTRVKNAWYFFEYEPMRKAVIGQVNQLFRRMLEERRILSELPQGEADMAVRIFTYAVVGIGIDDNMKTEKDIDEAVRQIFAILNEKGRVAEARRRMIMQEQ